MQHQDFNQPKPYLANQDRYIRATLIHIPLFEVWIADPTKNFELKKGPTLQEGRYFFSCAVFQDPDSLFNKIVVAGGYNQSRVDTNSVEILDPFPDPTISNKWEYGKY